MFIKTNQGLGRTNRNNNKKDKITKPKPNQAKKKKESHLQTPVHWY